MSRNLPENYDIAVVGGGPAGLFAGGTAASCGSSVIILEKMPSCGRKLLISGSGRCNLTNTVKDTKTFINALGANGKFLYQALNALKPADMVQFFNNNGLKTTVEKGFKVFPAGELGSADVLRVLMRFAVSNGAEILCGSPVSSIDGNFCITAGKEIITAKSVIIACGGMSYPKTGSSGDGYSLAMSMGHNIIKPLPVLVPAYSEEPWLKEAEGLSLKDVSLLLFSSGKKICTASGDLVFTDKGVSGPAVYDLSREAGISENLSMSIDLVPDTSFETLDTELEEALRLNNKKLLRSIVDGYFPPKLAGLVFDITGVDGGLRASNVSKKDRQKIVSFIKGIPLKKVKFAGFERAVVTKGGVDIKQVDGRSMQSKLVPGLFFAGEVLDLEGPTGGYNLQICWSTGKLAGFSAASYCKNSL